MTGPGEYVSDPSGGITDPKKLPTPRFQNKSRIWKKCPCPRCKRPATRHAINTRTLHHLGDLASGRPVEIRLKYSTHLCCKCRKYFSVDTSDIAAPKAEYTNVVVDLAVRLIVEEDLPSRRTELPLVEATRFRRALVLASGNAFLYKLSETTWSG